MEPTAANCYLRGGAAVNPLPFPDRHFEFEESDVWHVATEIVNTLPDTKKTRQLRKPSRKIPTVDDHRASGPKSLPVNVPDWSKILRGEYRGRAADSDDDEDDDRNCRLPPHEYLARNRGASFSVHEGVGRTLKGRDLSRVRNAIWKKTGFED